MIVVTGGAGFIGSNIVAALEARGLGPVVICDRLRSGARGKWRNIAKRTPAEIVDPDALFGALDDAAGRITAVVHMGAITTTTEDDADRMVETNVRLSVRLWRWAARNGVPFLYASSAATYGDGGAGFDDDGSPEALARLRPLNLYGWSKHLFDRWIARQIADEGERPPQWAGLKFFNVYGPNEYHKGPQASVASHLFPVARAGETARLFRSHLAGIADGEQRRDFVWVEDCVEVVLWLLRTPGVSGLFNCGSGEARTFADLARTVYRALGREPAIAYVPMPEAIQAHYQYFTEARLERLRAAGYDRPLTRLEDGVAAYVRGYLDTPDPYR